MNNNSKWILVVLMSVFSANIFAGQVFVQPTNWYVVQPSDTQDKTAEIQLAINRCRNAGGGTVYLPAGTFIISSTIKLQTDYLINGNNFIVNSPAIFNVRLCGAKPITGHNIESGETVLKWNGPQTSAVIDISSSHNVTVENIRITTYSSSSRFRYGIIFTE